jgi:hypothetical protein
MRQGQEEKREGRAARARLTNRPGRGKSGNHIQGMLLSAIPLAAWAREILHGCVIIPQER